MISYFCVSKIIWSFFEMLYYKWASQCQIRSFVEDRYGAYVCVFMYVCVCLWYVCDCAFLCSCVYVVWCIRFCFLYTALIAFRLGFPHLISFYFYYFLFWCFLNNNFTGSSFVPVNRWFLSFLLPTVPLHSPTNHSSFNQVLVCLYFAKYIYEIYIIVMWSFYFIFYFLM